MVAQTGFRHGAIQRQEFSKVSVELLDPEHYEILVQAIRNVLSTELAETTMAQVVDGLPLASSGWEARGSLIIGDHPLTKHETFCEGVINQTRAFRDAFDPAVLQFDSSVMQAYQNAEVGSAQFKMRMIELVAVAIHQIAVLLFQLEPKLHVGDIDSVVMWKEEARWVTLEGGRRIYEEPLFEPRPTLFFHVDYMDYQQYPDGLADVAGYWAEDRIFGGVVLFDRGDSGYECKDVYFHSGRKRTTFRVWRLLDAQFNAFADFLLSKEPSPSPPFPILASDDNLHRHDPWDAIALHHVFRDPRERKVTPTKPPDSRDVRSTGDYPELAAMFTEMNKSYELDNIQDLDSQDGATAQHHPPVSSELPSQDGEPNLEWHDTRAGETNPLFVKTPPPRSPVCTADVDSLHVKTPPPRSPVSTADVDSLHVKTPPETPILSATNNKAAPTTPLGDKESVPQALDQNAAEAQSPKKPDDSPARLPLRATDSVLGKRKMQDVDHGKEPRSPRG